jgi:hypothetical protein
MRKKGLLDKKPLCATNKMIGMAKADKGTSKKADGYYRYTEYGTRFYFRAQESAISGILEVDLFTRKDLASGKKEARFRIFIDYDKQDFITWNMAGEKWSSAKIDMLETGDGRYTYSYRGRNYASKADLNTVNRYLKTGKCADVETAVIDFQAKVRGDELKRRHKCVTDMIDAYMDTVPRTLPHDWDRFINDRVLSQAHVIVYHRDSGLGYCTHCRNTVTADTEQLRHNMTGKCSICKAPVTYKSWDKQKHITFDTRAAVIQRCTDDETFVYRQFRVLVLCQEKVQVKRELFV